MKGFEAAPLLMEVAVKLMSTPATQQPEGTGSPMLCSSHLMEFYAK